ncbi:TonB family protein [Collimonas humicola]|uniref:TonB family protein n=1 Tax=Collimonas humicola TaxID=2825886 RepID=UPI001B8D8DB2|nr:TonB family protein [Collimonas humicola]
MKLAGTISFLLLSSSTFCQTAEADHSDMDVKNAVSSIGQRIKSNITYDVPSDLEGNDPVVYSVTLFPDGKIRTATLLKSSGLVDFDKAVSQAIEKSQPFELPPNDTKHTPLAFMLKSRPKP